MMKSFTKTTALAATVAVAFSFSARHAVAGKDIVDTAVSAGKFKTLVAAVKAAGLVETLKGKGPFTVFAPTDEAFAKLPKGLVKNLLKPENKEKLVAILTYHVVPGKVTAKEVVKLKTAATVQGAKLRIAASDKGVRINNVNVVKTDILTSNGVIHVIDGVLLPPKRDAADARRVLRQAVAQGAPLYNAGHADRCAAVYHAALANLMSADIEGMSPVLARRMSTMVDRAAEIDHAGQRAWALRHAINAMYAQLSSH